jgi:hypothetical protein
MGDPIHIFRALMQLAARLFRPLLRSSVQADNLCLLVQRLNTMNTYETSGLDKASLVTAHYSRFNFALN